MRNLPGDTSADGLTYCTSNIRSSYCSSWIAVQLSVRLQWKSVELNATLRSKNRRRDHGSDKRVEVGWRNNQFVKDPEKRNTNIRRGKIGLEKMTCPGQNRTCGHPSCQSQYSLPYSFVNRRPYCANVNLPGKAFSNARRLITLIPSKLSQLKRILARPIFVTCSVNPVAKLLD